MRSTAPLRRARRLPELTRLAADALVAAVLSPPCASCGRALDAPLDGPVCPWCWEEARHAGPDYGGALRDILHAFKYEGRRSLAQPLATLLKERAGTVDVLHGADCVVPVPLHAFRRLRRGFNQAADLAAHLDVPVVHALWRVRATPSQTGLTAAGRRRNVHDAFRTSPLLSRAARERFIDDGVIVLVDDVMTTGATLGECAAVLMAAGAREVRRLTIARAALHDRP